jgi:hypothetical protein
MNRRQIALVAPIDRLAMYSVPQPDGCVVWQRSVNRGGYGQLTVNGRYVLAHRLAYEVHHGPVPDGQYVCHSCDNKICINPDHLWIGTASDNMQDAIAKGRLWWQRSAA